MTRPALQPIISPARPGLAEVFSGEQAWCAEKLRPARALTGAVPLRTFLEGPLLGEALDCLAARHAGADRRAVASFWTLYYVSALSIPYVVARMAGRRLSAEIDHLTLLTDETGLPQAFGLPDEGEWVGPSADPLEIAAPLAAGHLQEVALLLRKKAGLAPKLFFNNAAVYIDHALAASGGAADGVTGALFTAASLPDGSRNPFFGLLRHEREDGQIHCRRKICCLRYMLPGIPGCGELCALPELRKS